MSERYWRRKMWFATTGVALVPLLWCSAAYSQCPECQIGPTQWVDAVEDTYEYCRDELGQDCEGEITQPDAHEGHASAGALARGCEDHGYHYAKSYAYIEGRRSITCQGEPSEMMHGWVDDAMLAWVIEVPPAQRARAETTVTLNVVDVFDWETRIKGSSMHTQEFVDLEGWDVPYDGATVKVFYEAISEAEHYVERPGVRVEAWCSSSGPGPKVEF